MSAVRGGVLRVCCGGRGRGGKEGGGKSFALARFFASPRPGLAFFHHRLGRVRLLLLLPHACNHPTMQPHFSSFHLHLQPTVDKAAVASTCTGRDGQEKGATLPHPVLQPARSSLPPRPQEDAVPPPATHQKKKKKTHPPHPPHPPLPLPLPPLPLPSCRRPQQQQHRLVQQARSPAHGHQKGDRQGLATGRRQDPPRQGSYIYHPPTHPPTHSSIRSSTCLSTYAAIHPPHPPTHPPTPTRCPPKSAPRRRRNSRRSQKHTRCFPIPRKRRSMTLTEKKD